MDTLRTAELRVAYLFDCDECGTENVVRAVPSESDEVANLAGGEDEEGEWVTMPTRVRCRQCGAMFRTVET
jgi:uncharacterized Zn finger protein